MHTLAELIEKLSFSMQLHEAAVTAQSEFGALTLVQIHYLDAVRHLETPSLSELAEYFSVTNPTATVAIERLEALGFVKKIPSLVDRRIINIHLTESGRRISDLHDEIHQGYARHFEETLGRQELKTLIGMLNKVVKHIGM